MIPKVKAADKNIRASFLSSSSSCSLKVVTIRIFALVGILSVLREVLFQERNLMVTTTSSNYKYSKNQQQQEQQQQHQQQQPSIRFALPSKAPVLGLKDLKDLVNDTTFLRHQQEVQDEIENNNSDNNPYMLESWNQAILTREPVLRILERAGSRLSLDVVPLLPKWSDVTALYGEEPVIIGLDRCAAFRRAHRKQDRHVGIAGQFNTGTNALAKYFWDNLQIKENPNSGMLANVPWHKHGWVDMRGKYKFAIPEDFRTVLPVVIVRDPYFWMESMCESPYLMQWKHNSGHCPNLVSEFDGKSNVNVHVQWGTKYRRYWASLAHVWSEWYREYYEANFPRLIIRFEDLLFHTPKVLDEIRQCAGAEWKHKHVVFTTEAIKQKQYFRDIKPQSSMLSAVIKYGQDNGRRTRNMTEADLAYAHKYLDANLMRAFHYQYPDET